MNHPVKRLSRRELEVAALILAHPKLSYAAIGTKLGIGKRTVRAHVDAICTELSREEGFADLREGLEPRAALYSWLKANALLT